MLQFFKETNFQLISKRKITYVISVVLVLISIGSLIIHKGPKYNIDFTGGTLIQLKFQDTVEIQNIRTALTAKGYGDSEIKHFGSEDEISIHTGLIVETGINIRNHERAQANRAQIACKSVKNRLSLVYYFSYDATSLQIPSLYASFLSFSAILHLLPLSVAVRPPRSL